jgi:quercetin dioxygenase-like cupin family protein
MREAAVVRPADAPLTTDWLVPFREVLHQHDTAGLALYLLEYPPGGSVPNHSHGGDDEFLKDEIYIIEQGSGQVTLDGNSHDVVTGDVVWIPRGAEHAVVAGPDGLRLWGVVAWLDVIHPGRPDANTSH